MVLLFGFLPAGWMLARSNPEDCGLLGDEVDRAQAGNATGMPLSAALLTPAFWVFALATSLYGLAVSGFGLFNEAILRELGFDARTYHALLAEWPGGIAESAACWLGRMEMVAPEVDGDRAGTLRDFADLVTSGCRTDRAVGNAILMGAAGGMITVVFFAVWPEYFGRATWVESRVPPKC